MRNVSHDEIIGIWLKREFEENRETVHQNLPSVKGKMKAIVNSNDYQNHEHNRLRFKALDSFRNPLLSDVVNSSWYNKTLDLSDFMELRAIKGLGWDILSKFSGKISAIADLIYHKRGGISSFVYKTPVNLFLRILDLTKKLKCKKTMSAILNMERKRNLDTDLILLKSNDSRLTTILEGNKTAVALYIKYCLKEDSPYEPFRVFIGHRESRSRWQR